MQKNSDLELYCMLNRFLLVIYFFFFFSYFVKLKNLQSKQYQNNNLQSEQYQLTKGVIILLSRKISKNIYNYTSVSILLFYTKIEHLKSKILFTMLSLKLIHYVKMSIWEFKNIF